ncbi:MAG: hypothetical protein NZ555_00270 [Geminicoccaceae bacterium]|nr:hypothetical protein [Geminicoccaceae bacterium]MDW8370952.1 hypothetical protein [Geminicoccaceae bacterium]
MSILPSVDPSPPDAAIVVFEDRPASRALAHLRRGFRHCFCLLRRPVGWIVCDPLKSKLRIEVVAPYAAAELGGHYRSIGMIAVLGAVAEPASHRPTLRPLTCVEVVKRIVGVRSCAIWTPYQLYRALLARGFTPL